MAVSGDLALTRLADIIQLYAKRGEAVAIRVESPLGKESKGVLFLDAGEIIHAQVGEFVGVLAVKRALKMRQGSFNVVRGARAERRTVNEPLKKILIDALQEAGDEPPADAHDDRGPVFFKEVPTGHTPPSRPALPPGPETPPPSQGAPQPVPTLPPPLDPTLPPPPRSSNALRVVLALVALVAIGAAALAFLFNQQRQQAEEQAAEAVAHAKQAKAAPAVPLEQAPILFGMVGPLSGPAKELGRQMRTGIEVAFNGANEAGGVGGRKLKLLALDDGYEPGRTLPAMKELVEKHHVLGFIGNVGTPTAAVAVPYALEQKLLFFGAFTGAPLLRNDPPDRYVFNYRASYAEETAATVKYLVELRRVKPEQIAVFAQKDSYGDAGFEGVARTLRQSYQRETAKVLRVGYERNTADVMPAVEEVLSQRPAVKAVIMVATYRAAAKFIEKLREKGGDQIVTNVSFVGSTALADELVQLGPKFASGVVVTQVVPPPEAAATAVMRYRELLAKSALGEKPDFVSLEGYVAGSILAEGVRRAGKDATTEQIIDSLEKLKDLDLGFGVTFTFGLSQHQASHKVWGTVLDEKGKYLPLELD
jgi:ABC-type branched-subunit amino acid transport system substrate-binding protein